MPELTAQQIYDRQIATCRVYQAKADEAAAAWGLRAPPPLPNGTLDYVDDYRRDRLYEAKRRLPKDDELRAFKVLSVSHCPPDLLEVIEPQIYAASAKAAERNDTVPKGELREITRVDPANGMKSTNFYGQDSFMLLPGFGVPGCRNWPSPYRPGRQVVSFRPQTDSNGERIRPGVRFLMTRGDYEKEFA